MFSVAAGSSLSATVVPSGPSPAWVRQFGTAGGDESHDVSTDASGNVYTTGRTGGALGGTTFGISDVFVTKHDASGMLLWSRQLGSSTLDYGHGVAADGLGNVFVAGYTEGTIVGPSAGSDDAVVAKYDSAGNQAWIRQFGTSAADQVFDAIADGLGNVYVTGSTNGNLGGTLVGGRDAFLAKFDSNGNQLWARMLGSPTFDESLAVSIDGSQNVVIAGTTFGDLAATNAGSLDGFVAKYDASGNFLWARQIGTSSGERFDGVSADHTGNVYITGQFPGQGPTAGGSDVYVAKLDAEGNLLWNTQLGTELNDNGIDISVDGFGGVFVAGSTGSSLAGPNPNGISSLDDAFLLKFDELGALQWGHQLGDFNDDFALGMSVDRFGNVYYSGWTEGSLGGPNAGGSDAFLVKFTYVPEPLTAIAALMGAMILAMNRMRRPVPSTHRIAQFASQSHQHP